MWRSGLGGGNDDDAKDLGGMDNDESSAALGGGDDSPLSGGYAVREKSVAYEAPKVGSGRDLSADERTRVFFETMREQKRAEAEAKAAEEAAKLSRMDVQERAAYEAKVAAEAQHAEKKDKVITRQLSAFGGSAKNLLMARGRGRGGARGGGSGRP
jgi:hypothetical protein